jgi:hypothetical protein
LAQAESALGARFHDNPRDEETRYALGAAQFLRAFERLGQGLYRYGATAPRGPMQLPFPIPPNASPEPLDYESFRGLFSTYVDDLDRAAATLEGVSSRSLKLRLDLEAIRFDLDGDGLADSFDAGEAVFGAEDSPEVRRSAKPEAEDAPAAEIGREIAFDVADAIWMRGYANVFATPADFILAHDFEVFFNTAAPLLFPSANVPASNLPYAPNDAEGGFQMGSILAVIEAIHLVNWEVTEPERRARVRQRLLRVVALSRQNLAAIERERDDDHEWLPNPRQTSPFQGLDVTADRLNAWRDVLDMAEAVLNGEKLVPHPRFTQGVDVRAFLDEPTRFDLVLLATGADAAPYLREGEVITMEEFRALTQAMGSNGAMFALWFN